MHRDQTENQQNAATVDSCFELVGSRQHGVAQQKVVLSFPTQSDQPCRNLSHILVRDFFSPAPQDPGNLNWDLLLEWKGLEPERS